MLLVVRDLAEVAGNCEYEKRRGAGDLHRCVAHGIVPVTFGIELECGVDSDSDDVLVLVARFQRRKKHRSIACLLRILCSRRIGSSKALVIRNVCDVESCGRVPLAIALGREPLVRVPRRVGVAVKINRHIARVMHLDRCHWPRNPRSRGVYDDDTDERHTRRTQLAKKRRGSRAGASDAPHSYAENGGYEQRSVLPQRKQREGVHQRADRRQDGVGCRVHERRVGNRKPGFRIKDWCGPDNCRRQDQGRQYDCEDVAGSAL